MLREVETWWPGPPLGKTEGRWSLKLDQPKVVQAGTTQQVWVKWPVLKSREFQHLSNWGMCFEVRRDEMVGKPAQLARGIAPLRKGQVAKSQQWLLFHDAGETNMVLMPNDVLGHASLVASTRDGSTR